MVAFLGSTIGNFDEDERTRFFARARRGAPPGDWFLLGADLVKAKRRLDAAYNDAAGVTVQFNKNVLGCSTAIWTRTSTKTCSITSPPTTRSASWSTSACARAPRTR